jgi:DNA-binding MarR family transcriptional regulator
LRVARRQVSEREYRRLLAIRTRLREFERWSADRAAASGLTARQHQLLLAIRGHHDSAGPTIGQVADYLMVQHNTAVELVTRAQQLGLVDRVPDPGDNRVVRLQLTADAERRLAELTETHIEELTRLAEMLDELTADLRRP